MVLHSLAPTHAGLGECESGFYPGKNIKKKKKKKKVNLD